MTEQEIALARMREFGVQPGDVLIAKESFEVETLTGRLRGINAGEEFRVMSPADYDDPARGGDFSILMWLERITGTSIRFYWDDLHAFAQSFAIKKT